MCSNIIKPIKNYFHYYNLQIYHHIKWHYPKNGPTHRMRVVNLRHQTRQEQSDAKPGPPLLKHIKPTWDWSECAGIPKLVGIQAAHIWWYAIKYAEDEWNTILMEGVHPLMSPTCFHGHPIYFTKVHIWNNHPYFSIKNTTRSVVDMFNELGFFVSDVARYDIAMV